MSSQLPTPICAGNSLLCRIFQQAAFDTWSRLSEAARLKLRYGEETVTDSVLLDLSLKCPNEILCHSFAKWQEAENGADWEFWFTVGRRGIGCLVQAKRLYKKGNFTALVLRPRSAKSSQCEKLVAEAKARGLAPLYVFFTYPAGRLGQQPPQVNGCLVAEARRVERLAGNNYGAVSQISLPWHHLVCQCTSFGDPLDRLKENLRTLNPIDSAIAEIQKLPDYVAEAAGRLETGGSREAGDSIILGALDLQNTPRTLIVARLDEMSV